MVQAQRSLARPWVMVMAGAVSLAACTSTVLETVDGDAGPGDGSTAAADGAKPPGEGDAGRDDGSAGHDAAIDRDGGTDAAVFVDCGTTATQVFTSALGPYCPFQAGGVFGNCAVGEHCCSYAEEAGVASTCSAGATACGVEITTGFDWRCDEANDCPGGQVCCFAGLLTPSSKCSGQYTASPTTHATACRISACAAGETRTCGSQADCPLGTTCTAMRLRGKHFGFCRP